MPFLHRHRTICSVIQEIRDIALLNNDNTTVELCDEAETYAKRMSARLVTYKEQLDTLRNTT